MIGKILLGGTLALTCAMDAKAFADASFEETAKFAERKIDKTRLEQLVGQAERRCKKSLTPYECSTAYLAGEFSRLSMVGCRRKEGQKFLSEHGGTATSWAQINIEQQCSAAINLCRSNWYRFYVIFLADYNVENERQQTIVQTNLHMLCGDEVTKHAQN